MSEHLTQEFNPAEVAEDLLTNPDLPVFAQRARMRLEEHAAERPSSDFFEVISLAGAAFPDEDLQAALEKFAGTSELDDGLSYRVFDVCSSLAAYLDMDSFESRERFEENLRNTAYARRREDIALIYMLTHAVDVRLPQASH